VRKQMGDRAVRARRGRVLVVDDEDVLRSVLPRVLREHDVTAVASGREALEAVRIGPPFDAIITDVMMPTMTGIDLYRALAAEAPEQAHRVIFLTGDLNGDEQAFLATIPNRRLEKPFDGNALRESVRSVVDSKW
jgi:CheY-like chemotaxis protein